MVDPKWSFDRIADSDVDCIYEGIRSRVGDKLEFLVRLQKWKQRYHEILVVRKDDKAVAFICSFFDGWAYEPHIEFFDNISKRTILETNEVFFARMKCDDSIGVVLVKSLSKTSNLFNHLVKKNLLDCVGVVKNGDYRGDQYIYSTSGNAIKPTSTTARLQRRG